MDPVDDVPSPALAAAIEAFAAHLEAYREQHLADVVKESLNGEATRLPQRFLALCTRGMGGLLDAPIYCEGRVDLAATAERDRLAEIAYQGAKSALGA